MTDAFDRLPNRPRGAPKHAGSGLTARLRAGRSGPVAQASKMRLQEGLIR
jgi:hypothetical protein